MTDKDDACQLSHQREGDVEALLDELKGLARVTTDAGLATTLGVKPSAVAQWRRRKSVPQAVVLKVKGALYGLQREKNSHSYIERLPEELATLSRALAIAYLLAKSPALLDQGAANRAYALKDAAGDLGEAAVAASLLIRRDMKHNQLSAWEVFRAATTSPQLTEAIQELIYGGAVRDALGGAPYALPQ